MLRRFMAWHKDGEVQKSEKEDEKGWSAGDAVLTIECQVIKRNQIEGKWQAVEAILPLAAGRWVRG